MTENQVIVYEGEGNFRLEVKTDGETVWLTQAQMCQLFGRERSVITKHINAVFKEGELPKEGFVQILHKTSVDGGRPLAYYNLDVLISVGYRVKSVQGTRFRQWATRVLREMLLKRLGELKRLDSLEERVVSVEDGLEQVREGVEYLAQQLEPDVELPHRRVGFGAKPGEIVEKPYGRLQ